LRKKTLNLSRKKKNIENPDEEEVYQFFPAAEYSNIS